MEAAQVAAGLQEAQVWAIGAAVAAIIVSAVVSFIAAVRARRTSMAYARSHWSELRTILEQYRVEHAQQHNDLETKLQAALVSHGKELASTQQKLEDSILRLNQLDHGLRLTRTRAALQQAVVRGIRARTHLAEQNTGLAERDLTEADTALQRALTIAPNGLKPRIEEARSGLNELKEGVGARTFPVTSVEILADRIDAVIAAETE